MFMKLLATHRAALEDRRLFAEERPDLGKFDWVPSVGIGVIALSVAFWLPHLFLILFTCVDNFGQTISNISTRPASWGEWLAIAVAIAITLVQWGLMIWLALRVIVYAPARVVRSERAWHKLSQVTMIVLAISAYFSRPLWQYSLTLPSALTPWLISSPTDSALGLISDVLLRAVLFALISILISDLPHIISAIKKSD